MTDPNQPTGPPPSYDEVQNMPGGGAPPYPPQTGAPPYPPQTGAPSYPTQPYGYPNQPVPPGMAPGMPPAPYPDQGGFKYDQYGGAPQYPMQQNYGQVQYPMQPGGQYPYGGAPAAGYPPLSGDQAYYNAQGGVTVQPINSNNQMQRKRWLFIFRVVFVVITIGIMIYMLSHFLF